MRGPGHRFTGNVIRISNNGNGIASFDGGTINIGPIKESAVGKEVDLELVSDNFARCLDRSIRDGEDYETKLRRMSSGDARFKRTKGPRNKRPWNRVFNVRKKPISPEKSPTWVRVGQKIEVDIERRGISGIPIGIYNGREVHVPQAKINETTPVEITKVSPTFAMAKKIEKLSSFEENDSSPQSELSTQVDSVTTDDSAEITADKTGIDASNLDFLKQRAMEQSEEWVEPEELPNIQRTKEYSRSEAVKNYVKARSGGLCEGCGEHAPFISKTGSPYLHAHHIYELSEGGPDTIDSVIAICPNCHYRVHHGRDGEEYNRKLKMELSKIENQ